jgi:hypothetical protein
MKIIDESGNVYGQLTVLDKTDNPKVAEWQCLCSCGRYRSVLGNQLRRGLVTSCKKCTLAKVKRKHGCRNTRLYRVWIGMKQRCTNSKDHSYIYYGQRGIKVCEEWSNNFKTFKDWALQTGYNDNLTIERIDVNKDYCPENCRWITRRQQSLNKTSSYKITAWGETKIATEWLKDTRCKISSRGLLIDRLEKQGLMPELALTTPPSKTVKQKICAWGETKTSNEWENDYRCRTTKKNFLKRLRNGWKAEDAISLPNKK